MASGQIINVKLMRSDHSTPWGFRLQGGKDFAQPLSVVKISPSSLADQSGLQIGDILLKICGNTVDYLRHKEAQDEIYKAGNYLEMTVQRGGTTTWRPNVTPVGDVKQSHYLIDEPTHVTKTSLAKTQQITRPIGSGHNVAPAPFAAVNSTIPALVHKQYNSPVNLYSETNIAETLQAHTEILASGVKGINFMKPDAPVNKESAVYQMVRDEDERRAKGGSSSASPDVPPSHVNVTRHVEAPVERPPSERQDKANQNICAECERLILGVFVRIKDKSLHAECFRCATCGTSLKNVGYYNINDKLYCDIHAKQVASLITPKGDILPVPANQIITESTVTHSDVQSSGLSSSPIGIVAQPYLKTSSPPTVPPYTNHQQLDGYRSFSVTRRKEPVTKERPKSVYSYFSHSKPAVESIESSSIFSSPNTFNAATYESQQKISQYITAKPQFTPNWTGSATTGPSVMPAPGQATVVGSRPAPRRGRGLLKPQITAGTIPVCAACNTTIRGPYIVALGLTWCQQHFMCANPNCRRGLEEIGFVETERGKLYCETCYELHYAPYCGKCSSRIRGDCLNALSKHWHPECFTCAYCKRQFGNNLFYVEDGLPYCERDWNQLFTTKCNACGFPIEAGDRWVEALNQNFHSNCFKCAVCQRGLEGQGFYAKGGRPYCKLHAR